jgi:hypothetical protein
MKDSNRQKHSRFVVNISTGTRDFIISYRTLCQNPERMTEHKITSRRVSGASLIRMLPVTTA